jgi:crotonobetainyl-CoA:carnitine CoA-transferase CaiB-like acyl-CoA transferase
MFAAFNRNKRSVALDIRKPRGRAVLDRMIAESDVLVSAFRPSTARRRGLDAQTLEAKYPSLVVCEITAFGPQGPLTEQAGYDPMIQAFAGLMSINGHDGDTPARIPTSIMDMAAGMWAAIGVLACLAQRDGAKPTPRLVRTSLFETALAWLPYQILGFLATGDPPCQLGSELATIAPYGAYAAADRSVMIAAGNDNLWRGLCLVIDRPDLADDSRFATNPLRVANRAALRKILESVLRTDAAESWAERLSSAGVPATLIKTIPEVLEHPQTAATGMLQHAEGGHLPLIGFPVSLDGRRPTVRSAPPHCGEQTRSVLKDDIELPEAEIDRLEHGDVPGRP